MLGCAKLSQYFVLGPDVLLALDKKWLQRLHNSPVARWRWLRDNWLVGSSGKMVFGWIRNVVVRDCVEHEGILDCLASFSFHCLQLIDMITVIPWKSFRITTAFLWCQFEPCSFLKIVQIINRVALGPKIWTRGSLLDPVYELALKVFFVVKGLDLGNTSLILLIIAWRCLTSRSLKVEWFLHFYDVVVDRDWVVQKLISLVLSLLASDRSNGTLSWRQAISCSILQCFHLRCWH